MRGGRRIIAHSPAWVCVEFRSFHKTYSKKETNATSLNFQATVSLSLSYLSFQRHEPMNCQSLLPTLLSPFRCWRIVEKDENKYNLNFGGIVLAELTTTREMAGACCVRHADD